MSSFQQVIKGFGHISKTTSFNGYEFDTEADRWSLNKDVNFSLSFLSDFDKAIQDDVRGALVYFAEQKSAGYTQSIVKCIKKYQEETEQLSFSEQGLLKWKSILGKKREPDLGKLRSFLKQMHSLGYKALDDICLELLNGWRLSGGDRGIPVLSLCPKDGPFSDIEFEAILDKLDYLFAEGVINEEQYSIIRLFAATGRRPIQIAALKLGDLRVDTKLLGSPIYLLNIPRAKVRDGSFRAEFTDCGLIEDIGQVLTRYIKQVEKQAESLVGRVLSGEEKKLLPMFPDYRDIAVLRETTGYDAVKLLNTDVFHIRVANLQYKLVTAVNSLHITSERTKELLHVNAYRFRYTLGTRAARENAGVLTIATLLDHVDTQHAGVYVQNHPDHAAKISAIMSAPLMSYANAFQGKVVKNEHEAQEELPKAQRVRTNDSSDNVGSCGTSAFCKDYAPIACYLCPKFRPWQDAPHHLVLKYLVDERDRVSEETGDLAIASINDRAIVAVTQVIKQCHELSLRKELACD